MAEDCLPHGCELAVMEEIRFAAHGPEAPRQEFRVAGEELRRAGLFVRVERLDIRIIRTGAYVVQLEIGRSSLARSTERV